MSRRWIIAALFVGAAGVAATTATLNFGTQRVGKQADGSFYVSTGQRIEAGALPFSGRPIDLALHPSGDFFAVLNKTEVFLSTPKEKIPNSRVTFPRKTNAGFRGLIWSKDGTRLFASTDKGRVWLLRSSDRKLTKEGEFVLPSVGEKDNPVPGGMCLTSDGRRLFVVAANRNAVFEFDVESRKVVGERPVQLIPFECRLSEDESTLIVSNWGGRPPREGDLTAKSEKQSIVVDKRGVPASGTVTLIDMKSGEASHIETGLHPTSIVAASGKAYVSCALSDEIAVIDLAAKKLVRSIPIRWRDQRLFGSMPNALALAGDTLFVCNGGDNALCEVDLKTGLVRGFRPVGFFPVAVQLTKDLTAAFVLNTKGNGSVDKTTRGRPGSAHDFQGSVSVVDLQGDLARETMTVARNNHWLEPQTVPKLKVYNGAIEHVLYIIKENHTYDEIYGDLPQGNGDPALCSLGEKVMPNHRALARQFTLFDNAYVTGTNSADGHAWCTQCLANDYLEHFYVGYSRTYPDDGKDPMALSSGGAIWDAAVAKGKTLRVWGEFCEEAKAVIQPEPKDWFDVWEDRKKGGNKFKFKAVTSVEGLKPYIHPEYHYWPLWMSDQQRADMFIKEYQEFSQNNRVPQLMIAALPCDHGEGTNPKYPTPRAMMADNDLALGRIVEAVSNSPQWAKTCIFVIEDDAQSGPDHVDGHRTSVLVISPYTKRKFVDSTMYAQPNMFKSMELMLGLPPLNKFDACAYPFEACFTDSPDLTAYKVVPNNVPLDERNPEGANLSEQDRFWLEKTLSLDWSGLDEADPYWLNRINWYSFYKGAKPYPARDGEEPKEPEERDAD